jgi:hypothetical protein
VKRSRLLVPTWLYLVFITTVTVWMACSLWANRVQGTSFTNVFCVMVLAWNLNVVYLRVVKPVARGLANEHKRRRNRELGAREENKLS